MRNCARDGGGPPGAGLQEQAQNRLKLLWLRARVVSVKEKLWLRPWQVGIRETSTSEPLMRCRKVKGDVETGGYSDARISSEVTCLPSERRPA